MHRSRIRLPVALIAATILETVAHAKWLAFFDLAYRLGGSVPESASDVPFAHQCVRETPWTDYDGWLANNKERTRSG